MNNYLREKFWLILVFCLSSVLIAGCTGNSNDSYTPLVVVVTATPIPAGGGGGGGGGGGPTAVPTSMPSTYTPIPTITIVPPVYPPYVPPPSITYAYAGAVVTTLAGEPGASDSVDGVGNGARLAGPYGMAYDYLNTIYFAEIGSHTVRTLNILTNTVTTVYGTPFCSHLSACLGELASPSSVAISGGVPYIADTMTGRVVDVMGTLIAGLQPGVNFGYFDGIGAEAEFNRPQGVVATGGYLYVADGHNHCIRRIDLTPPDYDVTTFAGTPKVAGSWDGVGTSARFHEPTGMDTDGTYLYVADQGNHLIRRVDLVTAEVTTIAGQANEAAHVDGPAWQARFNLPRDVAVDGSGRIIIADSFNCAIRMLDNGMVYTISGDYQNCGHQDGPASVATFNTPSGVEVVGTAIYVSDFANYVIRKIQ